MTFLVTGADGQLGRMLTTTFAPHGTVIACARRDLDIQDAEQIAAVIGERHPSVILNCAAYNDVDGAEDHAALAFDVNALAVRSLARAAVAAGATLVHFSSDFVFDGSAARPYTEDDAPSPRSVYAASKLAGEWFAADASQWFVIRVESLFGARHAPGTRRIGTLDRIVESLEQRRPTKVLRDRVVSPSYLADVAGAVQHLIDRNAESGLYHAVNSGHGTWYEVAGEVARYTGGEDLLEPITASELALKAARPQFAALSNAKLAVAGYPMPTWQDALARYMQFRARAR
jgi:dTDP-4-dehydrorhamnose reductase